jgi:peptidoglycan LD-endopeptidase CwlK
VCFLLACLLAWVVLFADGRSLVTRLFQNAQGLQKKLHQRSRHAAHQIGLQAQTTSTLVSSSLHTQKKWLLQHQWHVLLILSLMVVPPLIVMQCSTGQHWDEFQDGQRYTNPQVEELIKGEQLLPPSPLPPEVFITAEVEQIRPLLRHASRNWQQLDGDFANRLLLVFKVMREKHGYDMTILEGYRSPERQNELASQGANVTNARAFQSYHQYGLAADCAFWRNGKLIISEKDPWALKGYQLYGQTAQALGLVWGGGWKMMDFGHIEWRRPGTIRQR